MEEKEPEEKKEIKLPPDFEQVKEDQLKSEEAVSEVYKSENYDKFIPKLIKAINSGESNSEDYPYFNSKNKVKYLPKFLVKFSIIIN